MITQKNNKKEVFKDLAAKMIQLKSEVHKSQQSFDDHVCTGLSVPFFQADNDLAIELPCSTTAIISS